MNLARFFSPSADTLLLHSTFSIDLSSLQNFVLDQDLPTTDGATILVPGISNTEPLASSVQNEAFDPRSALLIHKEHSPWCPERFVSQPSAQWLECLWQVWILSLGSLQAIVYPEASYQITKEEVFGQFAAADVLVSFGVVFQRLRAKPWMHRRRFTS